RTREQHRDALAVARLERGVGVHVDHVDDGAVTSRERRERRGHLVAQVTVGARQQREPGAARGGARRARHSPLGKRSVEKNWASPRRSCSVTGAPLSNLASRSLTCDALFASVAWPRWMIAV